MPCQFFVQGGLSLDVLYVWLFSICLLLSSKWATLSQLPLQVTTVTLQIHYTYVIAIELCFLLCFFSGFMSQSTILQSAMSSICGNLNNLVWDLSASSLASLPKWQAVDPSLQWTSTCTTALEHKIIYVIWSYENSQRIIQQILKLNQVSALASHNSLSP